MKIAVTGATGHIGTNLIPTLIQNHFEVRALIHQDFHGPEFPQVEKFKGDVLDPESMEKFTDGADTVIHLAAKISIEKKSPEALQVNIEGTRNMLRASLKTGVRHFIHFSSIHSLKSKPLNEVLDETRSLNLDSDTDYDRSKAEGERMVMEVSGSGLPVTVLNPTAVIGPNDYIPSLLGRAIINLYQGKIPSLVNGGYDWVDVRDIAEATLAAIKSERRGEKYMLSGEWKSMRDLAGTIHRCGGAAVPRFTIPFPVAMAGASILNRMMTGRERLFTPVSLESLRISHRNISHNKAARELGYRPRPFDGTIADTIDWFKKNKLIAA